ncbi:MAG TPA: hypothetical protein P5307_22985, partial [Pirellulaceae bacterium]|nr:hypothetical protein [Pirellulaceae bacterium]
MRALHSHAIPRLCGLLVQALPAVLPSLGVEPNLRQEMPSGDVEVTGEVVIWEKDQQLDTRILSLDSARDSQGAVHVVFYAYTSTEDLLGKGALVYVATRTDKPISEQHPQPHALTESTKAGGS